MPYATKALSDKRLSWPVVTRDLWTAQGFFPEHFPLAYDPFLMEVAAGLGRILVSEMLVVQSWFVNLV